VQEQFYVILKFQFGIIPPIYCPIDCWTPLYDVLKLMQTEEDIPVDAVRLFHLTPGGQTKLVDDGVSCSTYNWHSGTQLLVQLRGSNLDSHECAKDFACMFDAIAGNNIPQVGLFNCCSCFS
jgi:hypothetical protein